MQRRKSKHCQAIQGSSQHLRLLQIFVTSWILILSVYQRAVFPKFHQDTKGKKVGLAMSPDMEIVSSLNPDWILAPSSLETDLKPKFEELKNTEYAFLNLRSVQGMYRSVQELGEIFGKQQEAEKMTKEFTTFYKSYTKRNKIKNIPKFSY